MKNTLSSTDILKIFLFSILQVPLCLFVGLGILPNLILLIGFFRARKNKNQNILLSSINFYKKYVYAIGFITFLFISYFKVFVKIQDIPMSSYLIGYVVGIFLTVSFIYGFYLVILEFLFKRAIFNYKKEKLN